MNKSVEDCLIIGVDFFPNDIDMLMVMRRKGDETHIINLLKEKSGWTCIEFNTLEKAIHQMKLEITEYVSETMV